LGAVEIGVELQHLRASSTLASISALGAPMIFSPKAMFSRTVMCG
jgi:hypothetical protein